MEFLDTMEVVLEQLLDNLADASIDLSDDDVDYLAESEILEPIAS